MIIKLKGYLANLESVERVKPEGQRLEVPTITALADDVGISRVQMQRIATGDIKSIKLDVAGGIIRSMRERGFSMDVTDLLGYQEAGN